MELDNLMPMLSFVLVIAIIVVAVIFSIISRQARIRAWEELALRTGLQLSGTGLFAQPRLEGTYRGRALSLYTFTRSHGKSSQTYTVVSIQVNNDANLSLAIFRRHLLSGVGKMLGMQDVSIGDSEYDQKFVFRCKPENEIHRLMASGSLRNQLLTFPKINIHLDGKILKNTQHGAERDIERLQAQFDFLVELADTIDRGN